MHGRFRPVVLIASLGALSCSSHPEEGTLVDPGPGVPDIPGGQDGTSASRAVPISGGTLTVNGFTAVAADPDRDRIFVADLNSGAVSEIALDEGDEPGRSAIDGAGRAHVALRQGGAIVSVDLASRSLISRRSVCRAPRGIAYEPATDRLHVACDTGELVSLPASGGDPVRSVDLGRDLRDVIVRGEMLLVTRFRSAELITVDATGAVVATTKPSASATSASGFTTPTPTTQGFEPSVAWRAVAAPDGDVVVVHQRANPAEISIGAAGYYQTSDPCAGGIVHGTVSKIDPEADPSLTTTPPTALPLIVGPSDIAVSRDGLQVAVVSTGNSWPVAGQRLPSVLVMPLSTTSPSNPCSLPNQQSPSGEVTAVAFDGAGRVVVQSREPAQLEVLGGSVIKLSDDSRADTGTALFHMNSGFGVACASCHPEGREDGRIWQFAGVGPRRTQSFAGGLLETAPFHWNGDMEDLPALVHEVFVSRMGGPQPNRPQMDHFSGWLDRIPAPLAPVLDSSAVDRGHALFTNAQVGCSGCHNGDRLTNNDSFDVGTGGVFQVPALVGVGARSPFIHNGCATTLRDRFGACGGGDVHGRTSQLNDAEVDDLVTYLRSL